MALAPGTRLGPHEILSLLGVGGMGEVYKARDTRLERIVAIKVLPAHLADNAERRERFEREARTIANLNHPHICVLHDIGKQNGIDFLVMEYLEGETLAMRLMKGPLPLQQVLQYAIEIADALDKAHRNGVTHRDLKPGNIMLTKTGAKLLDFGLAKLKQAAPVSMPVSQLPTLSQNPTVEGTILGTLQYMAPEQVEGKTNDLDGRTDIFAFGALVYEMATGKKAFEGRSAASLIGAIMNVEPPPVSSLQPMTPAGLDRIVKRCLAKEPDERWQTASDLTHELKWVAEGGSQAVPLPAVPATPVPVYRRRAIVPVLAALALAAVAAIAAWNLKPAPAAAPELRTEIVTPSTNTTDPVSFALAPDGQQIVFVGSDDGPPQLWLRRLNLTEAQPLTGTDGASTPFWSPDSRSLGFYADGKLKRLDIAGGAPQILADATTGRGGTWSPDGTILFTPAGSTPLFRISASGGEPVAVTKLDEQNNHRFPQFLPDGRQFLFYAAGTPETAGVYLGSLDSSETKLLAATATAGAYLLNGFVLFVRGGTLLAQRLELGRGELTGDPLTVAAPVASNAGVGAFSVSATGLVAYRSGGVGQRQLVWLDRSGKALGVMGAPFPSNSMTLSPDSRRAAVWRGADIWLLDSTRTTRFTFDVGRELYPIWSPDGNYVVFDSNRKGRRDLYMKLSSGGGSEELLLESEQDKSPSDWSHDGRFLLYAALERQGATDLWVLPMEGDRKPFVFLKTNFDERRPQFSPDVRWVSYMSNQTGRFEIHVRPFNGAPSVGAMGGQWQVSTSGGISPRWRADGKELYYIAPDGKLMAAPIAVNGGTIEPGAPVVLFQTRIVGGGTNVAAGNQYDVSRDGRFLINTELDDATSPITLLQNWAPGLAK